MPTGGQKFWIGERGRRVERMWLDGATFQTIATELRATRNAVAGFIRRLNLERDPSRARDVALRELEALADRPYVKGRGQCWFAHAQGWIAVGRTPDEAITNLLEWERPPWGQRLPKPAPPDFTVTISNGQSTQEK